MTNCPLGSDLSPRAWWDSDWGQLGKVSELLHAVWKQRSALATARLMADMCCVALHTFSVLPGWACTDPQHPTELLHSQAPQLRRQLLGGQSGKCIALNKGEAWAGKKPVQGGNEQKEKKGQFGFYEEAGQHQQCPCRAADRNKGGEPNSCTDKRAGRDLSPQFNYSWTLAFLIPSLLA